MADDLTLELEHGRLTIAREAVAEIVAETTLGCYGVVSATISATASRAIVSRPCSSSSVRSSATALD